MNKTIVKLICDTTWIKDLTQSDISTLIEVLKASASLKEGKKLEEDSPPPDSEGP